MKERNITDTLFYKILQYFYFFLVTNIYFLITNIVFLLALLYIPISISSILLFAVALIPSGPSVTALFYTMRKLHTQKMIHPTKDFFRSYRSNFGISLRYWAIQVIVMTIFIVDILFVLDRGFILLTVISVLVFLIFLLTVVNGFSILSTFEVGVKNLMIFSLLMIGRYLIKSMLNLMMLFTFAIIWYGFTSEASLIIFSITVFYLIRNNMPMLDNLKEQYASEEKDEQV